MIKDNVQIIWHRDLFAIASTIGPFFAVNIGVEPDDIRHEYLELVSAQETKCFAFQGKHVTPGKNTWIIREDLV